MRQLLRRFDDPRLARKMAILRNVCAAIGLSVCALIVIFAARGELTVRGSHAGGRFVSDGTLNTLHWSDGPFMYLLNAIWYVVVTIAFFGALYLALAKIVEKRHGRRSRFFQRKYPH